MNLRQLIFSENSIWNISHTIGMMDAMFDNDEVNSGMYNEISRILQTTKFSAQIDLETMIPDPATGVYKFLLAWLEDWGVHDNSFDSDIDDCTIETYPCTDDDFCMEGEECISDDDEQGFVIFSSFIRQLRREQAEERDLIEH